EGQDAGGARARSHRHGLRTRRSVQARSEGRERGNPPPGRLQDGREVVRVEVPGRRRSSGALRSQDDPLHRGIREERDEGRAEGGSEGSRGPRRGRDRKSTRLNSSHGSISYAVFCLKKKNKRKETN